VPDGPRAAADRLACASDGEAAPEDVVDLPLRHIGGERLRSGQLLHAGVEWTLRVEVADNDFAAVALFVLDRLDITDTSAR